MKCPRERGFSLFIRWPLFSSFKDLSVTACSVGVRNDVDSKRLNFVVLTDARERLFAKFRLDDSSRDKRKEVEAGSRVFAGIRLVNFPGKFSANQLRAHDAIENLINPRR